MLAPVVAHAFNEIQISVSLWIPKDWWHSIHFVPNVSAFEYEYGVERRRWAHNARCLARAREQGQPVAAEHAGFRDLFVPVKDQHTLGGVLVAGPFAMSRPTQSDVLRHWHDMTGLQGHLSDPSFARYVQAVLSTVTLEGSFARTFERLLVCFADLLGGRGDATALAIEAETLRHRLSEIRFAGRMWQAARTLIDERATRTNEPLDHGEMKALGLDRLPQHAITALLVSRRHDADPLADFLRRHAFQHAAVSFARNIGGIVCGQLGDHGVTFLVDYRASSSRVRARLIDLVNRAAALARRFDFSLHAGISQATDRSSLSARHLAALSAAERALSLGARSEFGQPRPERLTERMRALRSELGRSAQAGPGLLSARFERYIETVVAHTGYRLEATRIELESGLERALEPLATGGLIDPKTLSGFWKSAEEGGQSARTISELLASQRRIVAEVEAALRNPTNARHDRGTRRALDFMAEHLSETLTLERVARAAGFAPDYFSKLFRHERGTTFANYLAHLRLDRAKQMLRGTTLTVEQVQRLCGFGGRTNFHRAFKKSIGVTPTAYRHRANA
jgi:AraC-like DNA-binding protein